MNVAWPRAPSVQLVAIRTELSRAEPSRANQEGEATGGWSCARNIISWLLNEREANT